MSRADLFSPLLHAVHPSSYSPSLGEDADVAGLVSAGLQCCPKPDADLPGGSFPRERLGINTGTVMLPAPAAVRSLAFNRLNLRRLKITLLDQSYPLGDMLSALTPAPDITFTHGGSKAWTANFGERLVPPPAP